MTPFELTLELVVCHLQRVWRVLVTNRQSHRLTTCNFYSHKSALKAFRVERALALANKNICEFQKTSNLVFVQFFSCLTKTAQNRQVYERSSRKFKIFSNVL